MCHSVGLSVGLSVGTVMLWFNSFFLASGKVRLEKEENETDCETKSTSTHGQKRERESEDGELGCRALRKIDREA